MTDTEQDRAAKEFAAVAMAATGRGPLSAEEVEAARNQVVHNPAPFRDWFFHKLDRMQRTTLISICLPMDLRVAQSLPTEMQFTACDVLFGRLTTAATASMPTVVTGEQPQDLGARWREVSRELPPSCVSVLAIWLWNKANRSAGALSHQVLWFDLGTWFDAYGEPQDAPTHWLPLPEPPAQPGDA